MTYHQTLQLCLGSKKRSQKMTRPQPSPQSPCPLPSIRPAVASTVSPFKYRVCGCIFSKPILYMCSIMILLCFYSCHHPGWSHPVGQQRHRWRAGPADADHGQHCCSPARCNYPAIRSDQWRTTDSRSQQPGGGTRSVVIVFCLILFTRLYNCLVFF